MHRRWMSSRRVRRAPLLIAAAGIVALTAACGGTNSGSAQPSGSTAPNTSAPGTTTPGKTTPNTGSGTGNQVTVSDAAATQLCDMLRPQLSDWRVQGPTLGKIAYNTTVHEWAVRNGGINLQVLGDKDVIDRITVANCSDVRDQALSALEMQSMAAGLL